MHLVDTSVWIQFLRLSGSPEIQSQLKPLIQAGNIALTEWIILELITGLRSNEQAAVLSQLAPASRLSLPEDGWPKAWDLAARLRKKGITASAADCLIATVATIPRNRLRAWPPGNHPSFPHRHPHGHRRHRGRHSETPVKSLECRYKDREFSRNPLKAF